MSGLEQTPLRAVCTCEGTLDMSEQFGLHQSRSQCRTINGNKRLLTSQSREVYGSCHQFFSCSGISNEQNRGSALADLSDQIVEKTHRRGLTDKPANTSLAEQRRARDVRVVVFHSLHLSFSYVVLVYDSVTTEIYTISLHDGHFRDRRHFGR